MDTFTSEVKDAVAKALAAVGAEGTEFVTEIPSVEGADLAVPCFTMAKALRKAPAAIAQDLAAQIKPSGTIASVTAVNGYLNFAMDQKALVEGTMKTILEMGPAYGSHPA